MKIVIAGSRKYNDYDEAREYIDLCIGEIGASDIVIISGGCTGARSMIECAVKAGKKVFLKRIEPCE